jgi:hypothetical protein
MNEARDKQRLLDIGKHIRYLIENAGLSLYDSIGVSKRIRKAPQKITGCRF